MTPERYQRVKGIFQKALELPPLHRPSYLDQVCDGDFELRRHVDTMLQSDTEERSFLDSSPVDPLMKLLEERDPPPPTRVGHYEIIREIGRGGMGAVYLASRADDQYRKQVAIKLVLRDRENANVLDRFRRERQILANLEHPNIAQLYDGGATPEGLPYLVMEYVEGCPIDDYCDTNKLNITERLKLFLTVCGAVQHAHQNLVIHRDLKPSNILVRKDGSVKLLDFGIAKLVSTQPSTTALDKTATAMRLLTPEYASPEQVKGDPVTTATDVYQLGVVLYLLATGHHPFAFKSRAAVLQMLLSNEPDRPSVAVDRTIEEDQDDGSKTITKTAQSVSVTREGSPTKLKKRLEGDLDAILLKALAKDPVKRYRSVDVLAADIHRHLEEEPVEARGHQVGDRARKFVRRHRTAVAAVAVIVLSLVAGIAVAAREAHEARLERAKAERRFQQVRRMANSLLFEVHDAMAPLAGTTAARQLLVRKALEYFDSLTQESSGDTALERELATAYHRVGDLQGNPNSANLGDTTAAITSYQKAMSIRESLLANSPQDPDLRRDLAASHEGLGDVLMATGNTETALASYLKSQTIREELFKENPSRPLKSLLVKSYQNVVALLTVKGDTNRALDLSRTALTMSQELAAEDPSNEQARRNLAVAHSRLGGVLDRTGDSAGALQNFEKALEIQRQVASDKPESAQARREISVIYEDIGRAYAARNALPLATENYRKALTIRTELALEDPKNVQAARDLGLIEMNMGDMFERADQRPAALESYRRALSVLQRLAAQDTSNLLARRDIALVFERLGNLQASAGNAVAALEHYRRLQELASEWATKDTAMVAHHTVGVAHLKVSEMLTRTNDRKGALDASEAALGIFDSLNKKDPGNVENQRGLAWAWIRKGEAVAALAQSDRGPSAARIQKWQDAGRCYRQSLALFTEIGKKGALRSPDAQLRGSVEGALAQTEQEIKRSKVAGETAHL